VGGEGHAVGQLNSRRERREGGVKVEYLGETIIFMRVKTRTATVRTLARREGVHERREGRLKCGSISWRMQGSLRGPIALASQL